MTTSQMKPHPDSDVWPPEPPAGAWPPAPGSDPELRPNGHQPLRRFAYVYIGEPLTLRLILPKPNKYGVRLQPIRIARPDETCTRTLKRGQTISVSQDNPLLDFMRANPRLFQQTKLPEE
jgi:hypothetical protein